MIRNVTYHILNKEQGSTNNAIIEINPNTVPLTDTSSILLNQINERYRGKAGKGYGVFEEDTDSYPISVILSEYLDQDHDDEFLEVTERLMNVLLSQVQGQAGATGGKVAFIHYEMDNKNYFLIAILTEKVGVIARNWDFTQDEFLNIDNMRFAGRINLDDWQDPETDSRYVSFLKGQGDVSEYFKRFMGCNSVLMAKQETEILVDYIKKFGHEQGLNLIERSNLHTNAKAYLDDLIINEDQFSMQVLANRIWPNDPQLLIDSLDDFGQSTGNAISDGFVPNRNALRGLVVHTHRASHWSFSFDDEAYASGDVVVEGNRIIFTNPPQNILDAYNSHNED